MGLKEAKRLLHYEPDLACCASLSLAAISPKPLSREVIEASVYNGGDLARIASLLRYSLVESGYTPYTIGMELGANPSTVLRDINKLLKTKSYFKFLGGLMMTKDMIESDTRIELHVIGILSIHSNDSAKIIDTMSNMRNKPMVRTQPFSSLDRRIMKENEPIEDMEYSGFFFVGYEEDLKQKAEKSKYHESKEIYNLLDLINESAQNSITLGDDEKRKDLETREQNGSEFTKRQSRLNRRLKNTNGK